MLDFLLRDAYYDRWGPGSFYTQQEAFKAYDARLSYILNYKGKYSGQVWKNWPQAIFSFNLQVRRPPDIPALSPSCNGKGKPSREQQ